MKGTIVNELKYKVFKSGNPLYLFIGLNVLVFLVINVVSIFEFLLGGGPVVSSFLLLNLSMPAKLSSLLFKPWTLFTYMFTQEGFFHLLFNMLWLYWLGRIFLDFLNSRQFMFIYLIGGLGGAILFLLLFNLLPVFSGSVEQAVLLGSSASVSAIVVGTAVLVPQYTIRMFFFGNVQLKYVALVFVILDFIGISGGNPGGNIAHLGGALLGLLFIMQLKGGKDWSKWKLPEQKKKHPFKVYKNENYVAPKVKRPTQTHIDEILDKILKSGYKSLTNEEKDMLFKFSKEEKED